MREWKRGQRVGVEDGGNSGDGGGCLRKASDGGKGPARRVEAKAAPTGLDFIWKESGPRRGSHMSSSSSELASYRQPW